MAAGCQPVACKLKRGQLKIKNKSKYIQTSRYCLDIATMLVQGLHIYPGSSWAYCDNPGRQRQCRHQLQVKGQDTADATEKADTLLNSISADPSKPLKKKKSNQRKRKELRLMHRFTYASSFPLPLHGS